MLYFFKQMFYVTVKHFHHTCRYLEENDVSEEDRVGDSSSDMGSDSEASLSSNDDVGQSPLPNAVGAKRPKLDEWSDED